MRKKQVFICCVKIQSNYFKNIMLTIKIFKLTIRKADNIFRHYDNNL